MTQRPNKLWRELKNKGVKFIVADDERSAINSIESIMGMCWTDAKGSRYLAHKMLKDFVPDVVLYSPVSGDYVDASYVPEDGEVLKERKVYRPMTVAEQESRMSRAELKRVRRRAEKAKPRYHREGSSRGVKQRLVSELTSEVRFGRMVARMPGSIGHSRSGYGDLSIG